MTGLSRRVLLFGMASAWSRVASAQSSVNAPARRASQDVTAAREALLAWTNAFRAADFDGQWLLTDPAIRRWHDRRRWRRWMRAASRRNGALLEFSLRDGVPAQAAQIPCTEQGHCYRPGVRYVVFLIQSRYERASPAQPEYAAMAWSAEGWRFGGGTFLNRPMGETSVILTEADERRYTGRPTRVQRDVGNAD
ncbi:MAG: hypothetical protein AB7P50_22190 [Alphaproteobacteria bacterium]